MIKYLVISLSVFATAASANMDERNKIEANNNVIKECLAAYNYSPDKFYLFEDWNKAAKCYSNWKQGEIDDELIRLRLFLKENPWYTGKNWQWEDCAKDNRCTKRFSWWSTKEK